MVVRPLQSSSARFALSPSLLSYRAVVSLASPSPMCLLPEAVIQLRIRLRNSQISTIQTSTLLRRLPKVCAPAIASQLECFPCTLQIFNYLVVTEWEDESPYPEVRAAVSNTDDIDMPVDTIRAWTIGLLWALLIPGLNQFLYLRYPSITIGSVSPIINILYTDHFTNSASLI